MKDERLTPKDVIIIENYTEITSRIVDVNKALRYERDHLEDTLENTEKKLAETVVQNQRLQSEIDNFKKQLRILPAFCDEISVLENKLEWFKVNVGRVPEEQTKIVLELQKKIIKVHREIEAFRRDMLKSFIDEPWM